MVGLKKKLTRFGDGKADALVAAKNLRNDTLNNRLLAKLDKRWAANTETSDEIPHKTSAASTGDLVSEQHLVEQIPLLWRNALDPMFREMFRELDTQHTGEVASLRHLFVDSLRYF